MKRQKNSLKKMTKEERKELMEQLKETPLEKGDFLAMVIAALLTFLPVLLILLGLLFFLIWFFFYR
ncbi:MAG TPA: hypothetical protein PKV63_02070 [Bacilli bacterium]|jgi:uncharacterized protein YaaW (UPF0174 family)|nr:MAG: hypothetical protein BWX94_00154 [Tenericutes bacterium ADurb.Bin140]HOE77390.1 hypothetical protein [Bacilli bacterium]HON63378.1 hypothetical protein [Bacilli bacterium]HPD12172.1 hypothetical protein [Bacilli bacterium]HPK58078.1 hypothetical protein [Bacilli bacterium]